MRKSRGRRSKEESRGSRSLELEIGGGQKNLIFEAIHGQELKRQKKKRDRSLMAANPAIVEARIGEGG